ncbi:hypothetical protein TFLX_05273 [Thermoflexales bacterium]|nr:hypothetical protein TFLX_05273 [Thermoflexales bacterium]
MNNTRTLFWDTRYKRLRAGWRILLQFALNIGLILLLGTVVSTILDPVIPSNVRGYLLAYPVMFVATLIAVWLAGHFLDRRRFSDFGLSILKPAWWADFIFGVVLALVPVLIVLLTLQGLGWIALESVFRSKLAGGPIVLALISVIMTHLCVGAFEEMARVYQVRNLLESVWVHFGRWGAAFVALGVAALISVCMHLSELELLPPIFLVYVLLDGVFLGLCYLVTGRAAIAIAAHSTVDLLLLTVFVLGTSAFFDGFVTLFRVRFTDPASTAFIATHLDAVVLIGLLIYEMVNLLALYVWVKMRYGKFSIADNLALLTLLSESNKGES